MKCRMSDELNSSHRAGEEAVRHAEKSSGEGEALGKVELGQR